MKVAMEMPEKIGNIEKKIERLDFDISKQIEPLLNGKNIIGKELDIAMDFINEVKS